MVTDTKKFAFTICIALLKLILAGLLIGFLKKYDAIIAIILLLKIGYNIYKEIIKPNQSKNWILLIGMIITGLIGIFGEYWGVSNGYWEYHEIDRDIPLWIPLAWMLAFHYLYKVEKELIPTLNNPSQQTKIILAIVIALLLPAFGEIITINLGVWTYYWQYQIFGVPLFAFVCLVFIHMSVYFVLHLICKKYKIDDVVYN